MQTKIKADNREIVLKTNGLAPILYKKELKRDFFADIILLRGTVDTDIICNLVWLFAKLADDDIPNIEEWLSGFETFPVLDYLNTAISLATACITTKKSGESEDVKKKTC